MSVVGSLFQFAGQAADVFGTLLHASLDIVHLVGIEAETTGGKHLGKAADDVEGGAYLVIHEVDEVCLATVGVHLQPIGLSQLIVERGELGIGVANVVDHPDQGALHEDEAVGQPSHAVTPRALRQRFVEVALGNAPGLFVEYLQWLNGVAHGLVAEQHEQEEAEAAYVAPDGRK